MERRAEREPRPYSFAKVYNARATEAQQQRARSVHRAFLRAFGLSAEKVPLLRLDERRAAAEPQTDAFELIVGS